MPNKYRTEKEVITEAQIRKAKYYQELLNQDKCLTEENEPLLNMFEEMLDKDSIKYTNQKRVSHKVYYHEHKKKCDLLHMHWLRRNKTKWNAYLKDYKKKKKLNKNERL